MRIEARLRDSARRFGTKPAVIAGDVQLTYAELDASSDRLAASLARGGIKPGDRVLMVLDNGHEAVVSFFGIWKAGAVPCPLYSSIKAEKLSIILNSTEASAIIAQARQRATVNTAISMTKIRPLTIVAQADASEDLGYTLRFEDLVSSEIPVPLREFKNTEALALLIHTSGSTGQPKGVMLTHANVEAACEAIVAYLGNTADDVVLSVLPLSFGYGITQAVTMVMAGGTLVLEKASPSRARSSSGWPK